MHLNSVAVYMKFVYIQIPSADPGSFYLSGSAFAILCVIQAVIVGMIMLPGCVQYLF